MLRFYGGTLLAALAAFVVSIAAATPASARHYCIDAKKGKFRDRESVTARCLLPLSPPDGSAELAPGIPAFITESGNELLFSGEGTKPTLRSEQIGQVATVECEKILMDGFALWASPLAHRVLISYHGKCVQKIGSGANETCGEPILTKRILAELGLLTSTNHKVVLLLAPSDGTTMLAEINCGGRVTTIGGTIVGEVPERNAKGEEQLNTLRSEIEVVFAANKTDHQSITEIFLLETQMTKDELLVEGFFGGPASEEAAVNLKGDGTIEINTGIGA